VLLAPPVAPPAGPANDIVPWRPPVPPVPQTPPPVAAGAEAVGAAAVAATEFGALGAIAAVAAVGVLVLVFWGAWNFAHPADPPKPPPAGRNSWWIEIEYETCTDFFPGLGFCIAWGGQETTQQFLPFVGQRNTIAYNLGKVDDIRYKIGFRDYDPVTGTYGPERQEYTFAAISDFGTKRSIKSRVYYTPIKEDGGSLDPIYPPWIQDPITDDPPWLPKPDPSVEPYKFPYPQPAIEIFLPYGPWPDSPERGHFDPDPGEKPHDAPDGRPRGPGRPVDAPPGPAGPGIQKPPIQPPIPGGGKPPDPKKQDPPEPDKKEKKYDPPIVIPRVPDLGPLIDLLGQVLVLEEEVLAQTEAEALVLDGIKILSQATRTDIGSIAVELGKLEAKMERTLERQTPKSLFDEFVNDLYDKLSEIEDSVNSGGDGENKPLEIPDMGPISLDYFAPADYKANGEKEKYEIRIARQKADKFMEAAILELFNYAYKLKVWRQFIAPKRQKGTPYRIVWEEVPEGE